MKKITTLILFFLTVLLAQHTRKTPIMGWSSWNNFRIDISEEMIREQADAMASNGMKEAGYEFINIDDGYFGGRDEDNKLISHPEKFPSGMKALADYIHSKGLKAGIYSDAGQNTCASIWDDDEFGFGVGLYGHEEQDLNQMLINWNYDFIKIDWCGGEKMGLDEEKAYTKLSKIIYDLKPECVYNVCRWQFPGEWVVNIADSWRISGDIAPNFNSILHIIDLNADLWKYSGPGHFNDMDMLQVGRGMTFNEDKAHFTMWCMMNSPLLAGNDLRNMSEETLEILTNSEVIALNQDKRCYQARRIRKEDKVELWYKKLENEKEIAIAILNRSEKKQAFTFSLEEIGVQAKKGYKVRDLWKYETSKKKKAETLEYKIDGHTVIALKISGKPIK